MWLINLQQAGQQGSHHNRIRAKWLHPADVNVLFAYVLVRGGHSTSCALPLTSTTSQLYAGRPSVSFGVLYLILS
jgi:hypothetical protein